MINYNILYNPSLDVINEFVRKTYEYGVVSYDIETNGLDPFVNNPLMLQFGLPDGDVLILSQSLPVKVRDMMSRILVIGHNLAFDVKFSWEHFGMEFDRLYDTMISEACLHLGKKVSVSLENVTKRYLGVELDKKVRNAFIGRTSRVFTDEELHYGARDVVLLFPIKEKQEEKTEELGLEKVVELENDTVLSTAAMEYNGLDFDEGAWQIVVEKYEKNLLRLLKRIHEAHPHKQRLHLPIFRTIRAEIESYVEAYNIASHDQNLKDLREFGFDVESTDKSVLSSLDHWYAKSLLEFRKLSKYLGTYLYPLKEEVHPVTGRIHFEYNQLPLWGVGPGARTGRYSCKRFQQIPAEAEFRHLFLAPNSKKVATIDYSNVELRIAGNLSHDPVLVEFFNREGAADYHGYMASKVFGYPIEEVSKRIVDGEEVAPPRNDIRAKAKTTNFAIIYLVSKYGLAKQLDNPNPPGLPENATPSQLKEAQLEEAQGIIDSYYNTLNKLMPTLKGYGAYAKKHRHIRDQSIGRIRWFEDEDEDWQIERPAANFPIQSTSASQMKLALNLVRKKYGRGVLLGTVHDEGLYMVDRDGEMVRDIERIMIQAAEDILKGPIGYGVGTAVEPYWTK